ncbi:hypothetical protein GH741_06155 [Aquibacillus halophilus]|uniref:Magnesium transporter MgtE intracellular domain-containing protein n=1 Tax=Aquibacillus halophilus TaxID=930132 RepID=A0A6A8DER6_9BACI|nr:MotE family protein [Aquibacillus halophilus]MRH42261.1 hypothetical protein [Aquibacillus halophilus]
MASNDFNEEKTKAGFLQWSLVLIIPLVFAITLALIIMTFAGIDIIGKTETIANKVPLLSEVITTEDERAVEDDQAELLNEISTKNNEIDRLTADVQDKENTIEQLNQEIADLTIQMEEAVTTQEAQKEKMESVATSFSNMEPSAAAPIITNLEDDLAGSILEKLSNEVRGQILGEMEPEEAARLTNYILQQTSN